LAFIWLHCLQINRRNHLTVFFRQNVAGGLDVHDFKTDSRLQDCSRQAVIGKDYFVFL
jgi:hypothetical protein